MAATPVLTVEYESWDGEQWFTLSGPPSALGRQGVVLGRQVSGIWEAPTTTIYESHAFQTGSSYRGKRRLQRDITMLVHTMDGMDSHGLSWDEIDDRWRRSWSYEQDGKLWVTSGESRRYLKVRLQKEIDSNPSFDPRLIGRDQLVMPIVAGDPYWYEPDETQIWVAPTSSEGGTASYGSFTMSNPTDTPMWPVWVCQAPGRPILPDFSWGSNIWRNASAHATRQIVLPTLLTNEHLVVNTDIEGLGGQFQSSLDTAFYMRMGGMAFLYSVPPKTPYTTVPAGIVFAPAGAGIQLRMPRRWTRPVGG